MDLQVWLAIGGIAVSPLTAVIGFLLGLRARKPNLRIVGAGEGETVNKKKMLQAKHPFDIRASIDARAAFRDAQIGKLRLPTSQDVRLNLGDLAHLRRPKHRAVWNRDVFHESRRSITGRGLLTYGFCLSFRSRRRTVSRIGVPSKPKDSRKRLMRNRS